MSDLTVRPASPTPSISLPEIKAETRLVLKSFLRQSLSIPPGERPGRIGGGYKDPNKYRSLRVVALTELQSLNASGRSQQNDDVLCLSLGQRKEGCRPGAGSASLNEKGKKDTLGWDSLDEEISAAEEKKHGLKNFIKKRLRPRPSMIRHAKKDGTADQIQNNSLDRKFQSKQSDKASSNGARTLPKKLEEENMQVSSASEEEGERKAMDKQKKKKKLKIPNILKKVSFKKEDNRPQRPDSLPIKQGARFPEPGEPTLSPTHPPEFYDGVANTLDKIAQKHSTKKKSPVRPEPASTTSKEDKEAVVQQLVQILTSEGDAMNDKINANPFLRSTLTRLSYASFAKLLDTYASESEESPLPATGSPTLRRIAITMEASRRVVTATGVQRLTGFAERYMESFAPWVKSHGGWENVVNLEENSEYD